MLLQESARQKRGNTIAFIVALVLIIATVVLLMLI